jgi:flagellar motor protein MotB
VKKFYIIFLLVPFFVLNSCETITDWTESMIPDGDDVVEADNDNQELLSAEDPSLAEILADEEVPEDLEISEERLTAVPTTEYDSILIDETTAQGEDNADNALEPPTTEPIRPEFTELSTNENSESRPFRAPESLVTSLNLKDKIQFRVATINFRSGSSIVDGKGLKKIKKIAQIANERNARIKIIGHASERTKDMPITEHKIVNFMISDKRAHSVANIFIDKHNFPSDKLITEAVSDTKPLFKEIMPAGTIANQRTEIFLIY